MVSRSPTDYGMRNDPTATSSVIVIEPGEGKKENIYVVGKTHTKFKNILNWLGSNKSYFNFVVVVVCNN